MKPLMRSAAMIGSSPARVRAVSLRAHARKDGVDLVLQLVSGSPNQSTCRVGIGAERVRRAAPASAARLCHRYCAPAVDLISQCEEDQQRQTNDESSGNEYAMSEFGREGPVGFQTVVTAVRA